MLVGQKSVQLLEGLWQELGGVGAGLEELVVPDDGVVEVRGLHAQQLALAAAGACSDHRGCGRAPALVLAAEELEEVDDPVLAHKVFGEEIGRILFPLTL